MSVWLPRGEPCLGRLPRSDCLPVCVCVCVCDCVWFLVRVSVPLPLLCLSCLFTLQGSGENRALLDPVTVSPLRPKSGPFAAFVLPQRPPYMFAGFGLLIPDFNPTLNRLFTAVRDLWRAERRCLFKGWMLLDTAFGFRFQHQRDY